MNRSFYNLGIFFTALSLACGILHRYLFLKLSNALLNQTAFFSWMFVYSVIALIQSCLLLKYYHAKNYNITFKAGIVVTVLGVCQAVVLYFLLTTRRLEMLYIPIAFLLIIASILYGISMTFSISGTRRWLKITGIFLIVSSTVLLFAGLGTVLPAVDTNTKSILQNVVEWTSAINALGPVFILANFVDELKNLQPDPNLIRLKPNVESILKAAAILSLAFSAFFGIMLFGQSQSTLRWQKQNAELAKASARDYEARFVVSTTGDTLKYQFMKPLDYDPQRKYPLVLCLHHGGTHGNDNVSQLGADPAPFLVGHRNKYPAFYLMPQCPKGVGWNSIDAPVMAMIKTLEDEFEIDARKRYVLGISGGGYGSWHFITEHPEMFAAAVPICGGGNPGLAAKIASIPVWAFHGEDDNLVPARLSREMIEEMKKAGGSPKYTEFPGAGHNIWNNVAATGGLMDWIFEQERDSL